MIEKKEIELHELKYYYDNRHGFVFTSDQKSSDENTLKVCEAIKNTECSNTLPEFYVEHGDDLIFVYPEDALFMSGEFFVYCRQIMNRIFMGMRFPWKVDILNGWLQDH